MTYLVAHAKSIRTGQAGSVQFKLAPAWRAERRYIHGTLLVAVHEVIWSIGCRQGLPNGLSALLASPWLAEPSASWVQGELALFEG